jgi:hypothetical protein
MHARGHECTSSWITQPKTSDVVRDTDDQEERAHDAMQDVADIDRSDVLVQFTEPPEDLPWPEDRDDLAALARGGRHWEMGYAYARSLFCVVVGPRENLFHSLPAIVVVPDWAAALVWMDETQRLLDLSPED